jgi:hypothetical protein
VEDRHRLRATVLVGALAAVTALVAMTVVFAAVWGQGGWWLPSDAPVSATAGLALLHGHLAAVYASPYLYELPLSLPFTGAVAGAADALHLPGRDWLLWIDACNLIWLFPLLYELRSLAWDLGLRRRLALLQAAVAAVAAVPTAQWGHPEDLMALVAVTAALRCLLCGRDHAAAWWLAAAIASKQWAVMLVPLMVLAAPRGRRVGVTGRALAPPALLASVFLAADFHRAWDAFAAPRTLVQGFPGHPWLAPDWLGAHSSQANRALAVVLAGGLTWVARRRLADPLGLVSVTASVLVLRPLFETISYSYYWIPALALGAVAAAAARPEKRFATWSPFVAAAVWTFPRSNPVTDLLWWAGMVILLWLGGRQLTLGRPPAPEGGRLEGGTGPPVLVAATR